MGEAKRRERLALT
jgi:hypothetical protein